MASILEILKCARELAATGHWTKGTIHMKAWSRVETTTMEPIDTYCMVGLVAKCAMGDHWVNTHSSTADCRTLPEATALGRLLYDYPPMRHEYPWGNDEADYVGFNDAPYVTEADIIAAFDYAIAKAEQVEVTP